MNKIADFSPLASGKVSGYYVLREGAWVLVCPSHDSSLVLQGPLFPTGWQRGSLMPRWEVRKVQTLDRAIGRLVSLAPDGIRRRLSALWIKVREAIRQ